MVHARQVPRDGWYTYTTGFVSSPSQAVTWSSIVSASMGTKRLNRPGSRASCWGGCCSRDRALLPQYVEGNGCKMSVHASSIHTHTRTRSVFPSDSTGTYTL